MRRREFITLLGGAAATWPLAARAQQTGRLRRIGVLTPFAADDAEGHARLTAFAQALQQSGWTDTQGREARRSAGSTADFGRVRHQPQDRQGARLNRCPHVGRAHRSGNRIAARYLLHCVSPLVGTARKAPESCASSGCSEVLRTRNGPK